MIATPSTAALPAAELSLLDRMTATLGPERVRDELQRMRLQDFCSAPLPGDWAALSAWEAGPSWIWALNARPSQLVNTDRRILSWRCGRFWGKNRAAAEHVNLVAQQCGRLIQLGQLQPEAARIGIVGRSSEDVRDNQILGVSGVIARSAPWARCEYLPGSRRVRWANGVEALAFSSSEPGQLRGQNLVFSWADEVCAWGPGLEETMSNLELATRLGPFTPKILVSSTPKPLAWLRAFEQRPDVCTVHRPSRDNEGNLSAGLVRELTDRFAGWIGAQELNAEILGDDAASFFPRSQAIVLDAPPSDIQATVRRWDLAATAPSHANPDPDFTCGVKMGRRANGRFVVLHAAMARVRAGDVEDLILRTADFDGRDVPILIPQDPGQAGVAQVADLVRKLAGFVVKHERETGPKQTRALPLSSQWQHSNIERVSYRKSRKKFALSEGQPQMGECEHRTLPI
ncbi:MAG TPA: hypothetical protein VFG23_18900 [Polyangia bacterium]|nr:hypothetical protein [Polyangia bacterium]